MTEIRLHKLVVTGVYGLYDDGVLVDELVTNPVPMLPGKRLTFEALDTAMQSRITPEDIGRAMARPVML